MTDLDRRCYEEMLGLARLLSDRQLKWRIKHELILQPWVMKAYTTALAERAQ